MLCPHDDYGEEKTTRYAVAGICWLPSDLLWRHKMCRNSNRGKQRSPKSWSLSSSDFNPFCLPPKKMSMCQSVSIIADTKNGFVWVCTVCVLELTHTHTLGLQNLIFNSFVVFKTFESIIFNTRWCWFFSWPGQILPAGTRSWGCERKRLSTV